MGERRGRTITYSEGEMMAMNDLATGANATLPGLIERAAAALATATTAAEVLDAKSKAGFAYTTAKAAAVRRSQERSRHRRNGLPQACRYRTRHRGRIVQERARRA